MLKRFLLVLFLLAATALHAAEPQYVKVTSPHFTVITDAGEKQGRHVLDNFEQMRWVFQTVLAKSSVDPNTPIVVIAMKNKKGFQTLEPESYLAKDKLDLAGLFLKTQDKNFILLRLDTEFDHPFATVYHEYTHLQYSGTEEWMPLWLFEGIAEFFQNTDIHDKDTIVGEPSPNDIYFLRQTKLIPLETLFRVDSSSPYYHEEDKGSIFYAESWALTHFLMSSRTAQSDPLAEYMKLTKQHIDPVAAAVQAFGDLKKLKVSFESYISHGDYKQFVLKSGSAVDESSYKVSQISPANFDVARAEVLVNVGRIKEARSMLEAVIQANPKNAGAWEAMGFLEFREGNRPEARKRYEQAIQLDSQSYLSHFYFAMLSLADYGADGADVETNLRAAIALKPNFASAYDQLASYLGMKRQNLDEAQNLNLKAVQLDPGNVNYRVNAANLMEERARWDDAEKVLNSAAKMARSPAESAMVQNRIEQLATMKKYESGPQPGEVATSGNVELATPGNGQPAVVTVARDAPPKHPNEEPIGPKHTATGVIRNVKCDYPSTMDFQIEIPTKPAGKSAPKQDPKMVALYTNNYYKLDLSAFGFQPKSEMNVCADIEGMKAQVQYCDSSDKSVNGQAIAIMLMK